MVYSIEKIVRDVRVCLDQNMSSEALLRDDDVDTLSLNDIIHSKIEEAVRRVETMAPVHLLSGGLPFGDDIYWNVNNTGWTYLPDDFMRLVIFRMNDWERPVYEPITPRDPQYKLQSSRYPGLRGTPQKPVAAIANRLEGLVLEFFSCKNNNAYPLEASYLPMPKIDCNGGIDICPKCYTAVVYQAAALVMATIGNIEKAASISELSKSLLK